MNIINIGRPDLKTGTNVYLDTNNGYPSIQTNTSSLEPSIGGF